MKIVINLEIGLSDAALKLYLERKGMSFYEKKGFFGKKKFFIRESGTRFFPSHICRTDPVLIEVVEELGESAKNIINGNLFDLKIIYIPDNLQYSIETNCYGEEQVVESHRTWS